MKSCLFLSLLFLGMFLAACSPAASGSSTEPPLAGSSPTVPASPSTPPPTAGPTEAAIASPLPLATSRGPELHATDPTSVSLAAGDLQLVEFFRFT